ncbi:MAG: adenosylcobinamide-GDP ribazoletransferase [Actinomycetota bacterium]
MNAVRSIATAFAFLTRIPTPVPGGDRLSAEQRIHRALLWFPLVGLAVGLIVGGVYLAVSTLTESIVAAAVAVAVGVGVTGGFHEDGLGDTADGFGGGWTVARRLEIMRDSTLGTYGVLAITCVLIIRVAAVSALTGLEALAAIATAHLLARNVAMAATVIARPARSDGLASSAGSVTRTRGPLLVFGAWTVVAGLIVGPGAAALMLGTALLATVAVVRLAYRKIGGVTGDVLGAVEQVVEAAVLVTASITWLDTCGLC